MSSFTRPLRLEQIPPDKWKTTRGFIYCVGKKDSSERYEVPCFFLTDLASIPRILWSIVGHPAGAYAQAAVLHDFLYKGGGVSRNRADKIFLEAMGVLKIPNWKRKTIYWGVRVGGWMAWNKHRKNEGKAK